MRSCSFCTNWSIFFCGSSCIYKLRHRLFWRPNTVNMKPNEAPLFLCFALAFCFDHTNSWHIYHQLFNSARSGPTLIGATRNKSKQEVGVVPNRAHNAPKLLMFSHSVHWVYMFHVTFSPLPASWFMASSVLYPAILRGTCAVLLVLILILFNSVCLTHNSMQVWRVSKQSWAHPSLELVFRGTSPSSLRALYQFDQICSIAGSKYQKCFLPTLGLISAICTFFTEH